MPKVHSQVNHSNALPSRVGRNVVVDRKIREDGHDAHGVANLHDQEPRIDSWRGKRREEADNTTQKQAQEDCDPPSENVEGEPTDKYYDHLSWDSVEIDVTLQGRKSTRDVEVVWVLEQVSGTLQKVDKKSVC